jgi:pimeloyl-ACP methyl ester carboxylesterase
LVDSSIYVNRRGHSDRKVVMVHGSAQGGSAGGTDHFIFQQALINTGWELIIPDRPGHGRSASPGRPDDADADGQWVAELLGDGAHLVGHSFGGAVALNAASRRPSAVHSLTIIEPALQKYCVSDPDVKRFVFGLVSRMLLSVSPTQRIRRVSKFLRIPEEVTKSAPPAELKEMGKWILKIRLPEKAAVQRELDIVKAANIPFLVISGGWSPGFDATSRIVAAAGGGEAIILPTPHHFVQAYEWGTAFNERLVAFMESADAKRGVAGKRAVA